MEMLLGSHHFLLIMKHTPPPLVLPASAVLSIRKTEKLSDGVTAVSGTEGVRHVLVKQRMLQSLMSCAHRCPVSPFPQSVAHSSMFPIFFFRLLGLFRWPLFFSVFQRFSNGHIGFVDKVS